METLERVSVCFPLRIFLLLLANLVTSPITGTLLNRSSVLFTVRPTCGLR